MLKDKVKIILLMMITIIWIVVPISWSTLLLNLPYPSMECKYTTTKEIERIIKCLKTKNSYGYDEISTEILKISCPFMGSPINYICNKMLFWGVFPD
jgi:hypothetical protein